MARPRERQGWGRLVGYARVDRPARRCRTATAHGTPIAKRLWDALKESRQADLFQASDWALADLLCEDLSF
ncbi:phage terminase small subunit [Streptomyces sp. NPDC004365]